MIFGIGTDIIEISRVKRALERNENFLRRIFTEDEIKYFKLKNMNDQSIAGAFAAKEAVSKALGTGISGFKWTDIEILRDDKGKPIVAFYNQALEYIRNNKISKVMVTISHCDEYATAFAIAEIYDNYCAESLIDKHCEGYKLALDCLKPRLRETHKGSYGKLYIVACSKNMPGAGVMSARSAMASGSGSVVLGVPEVIQSCVGTMFMEGMTRGLAHNGYSLSKASIDEIVKDCNSYSCVLIGPGLSQSEDIIDVVRELITNCKVPLVIDADALNALSKSPDILKEKKGNIVITPHPGEMARLLGSTIKEVQIDREAAAKHFSKKYGIVTVLKGNETIVASHEGALYKNCTGNPGMATAGSGDVLAGIIASFIGQGIETYNASVCGTYIHGLSGDLASNDKGEYGLIAGDIISYIPHTIKSIVGK